MYVAVLDSDVEIKASDQVRAPFTVLEKLFGVAQPPGEKMSTMWLVGKVTPPKVTLCVRDWQDQDAANFSVEAFRRLPYYDWIVDGPDRSSVVEFCQWLSNEVIRAMGEKPPARQLTAASKAKMNDLIRAGVSPGDALARVAEWEETPSTAEQFCWPIREVKYHAPGLSLRAGKHPEPAALAKAEAGLQKPKAARKLVHTKVKTKTKPKAKPKTKPKPKPKPKPKQKAKLKAKPRAKAKPKPKAKDKAKVNKSKPKVAKKSRSRKKR